MRETGSSSPELIRPSRALLALLLVLVCTGCTSTDTRPDPDAPAPPLERLRIGTSGDYPPFSRNGAGFDIDVAEAMATDLGFEIEWLSFRWPELSADLAAERFDVAMSGVTWRAHRAVRGEMSRAVAQGGPCLVGAESPRRLAVNRGGILERFTRQHYPRSEIVTVDDNLTLPDLLSDGKVDAFMTDSFELRHFHREPWPVHCHPATDRKVYWVSRARARDLAPRIEGWLREHEDRIQTLRRRHFGAPEARDEIDHLVDLLSRRLELMPWVAAYKREHDLPIEDLARERLVLENAATAALEHDLQPGGVESLFVLQIELAKAVQRRSAAAEAELDLTAELRPALLRLGERILDTLERCSPLDSERLTAERMALLSSLLEPTERESLREALLEIRPATSAPGTSSSSSRLPCRPGQP